MNPWLNLVFENVPQHLWGYRMGAIAVAVLGLSTAVFIIAKAPSEVAQRVGLRGLKRQRAIATNEAWATIEPFVRWLGVRLTGILTVEQRADMDKQLALAGDPLGLTPEEYVAFSVVSAGAGLVIGLICDNLLEMGAIMPVLGTVAGAFLPYLQISGLAQDRLVAVSRGLPYVVDLMALALSAGADFPGAIREVVEKASNPRDPIVEEFTLMLQSIGVGRTRRDALLDFAQRAPVESVTEFVNSLVQAEERGKICVDS
jgi:tight adherence protein C